MPQIQEWQLERSYTLESWDLSWSPGSFPRLTGPMAQAQGTHPSNGTDNNPSFPRTLR